MCWLMIVGGQFSGNFERMVNSASTPPVDEPMAMTRPSGMKRAVDGAVTFTSRGAALRFRRRLHFFRE